MNFDKVGFGELLEASRTLDDRSLNLAYGLSVAELDELRRSVKGPLPVTRHETLYHHGGACDALYVVENGSFKTYLADEEGGVQITGFRFAGEFLGLDALHDSIYHCTAIALERGYVFRLPTHRLADIVSAVPGLERELLRLMSRRIREDEEHMLLMGQKSATERVATYLLYLHHRDQHATPNPLQLYLPMTRRDLAEFLGLAVETVSRIMRRFEENGLVSVRDRKHVVLLDLAGLARLADLGAGADG